VVWDLNAISWRWCAPSTVTASNDGSLSDNVTYHPGPTPHTSGILSISTAADPDTIEFSIDLSKEADRAKLTSKSVISSHDEYRMALPRGALRYWDTAYIMRVSGSTFYSYTNEPNVRYEWQFRTGVQPPPLDRIDLSPAHNEV